MKKIISYTIAGFFMGVCLYLLYDLSTRKKTVYVNTFEVYNQFSLKKELQQKLEKTQLAKKVILDSLRMELNVLGQNQKPGQDEMRKASELREQIYYRERRYKEEDESQAQQYTNQVWEQLNQYMKDYGKSNGYQFVLGASGQGNLMYADEKSDVTKEVVTYVNAKYQGK